MYETICRMFNEWLRALVFVLCGYAVALPAASPTNSFERPENVATSSVVPEIFLRSAHYDVDAHARTTHNFYHFSVTSDVGTYEVASLAMLRIRLHEISTIIEVAPNLEQAESALNRAPRGRRGVGSEHVVDILSDPLGTASQLLGNFRYNLEETFADRDVAGAATLGRSEIDLRPGPHKRSAASQLGVDVYSSNPHLQTLLASVARARSAGETGVAISPLIRNVYRAPAFGTGLLDAELRSKLKNQDGDDLNGEVRDVLAAAKIKDPLRGAFVTHPAYTPRTRLYFAAYFSLLGAIGESDRIVAAAISARTEVDALAYVNYARMLAHFQLHGGALAQVLNDARFPTLKTADGHGVLALPVDYLAWTAPVAEAAQALGELRTAQQLERFVVLLAGEPTTRTTEELRERTVEVRVNYSF